MPGRPLLYGGILILCLLLTSMPLRATSFVIGNSRLTFITDHLVRLEYALHQEFLNDSTLFAVVRGEYPVDVKHEQEGRKHVFSTRAMRLEFDNDGFPFGQNNLKVSFSMNGETKHWCLTDGQQGNLKGALTTVDGIGGPTTRQEGLLSRDGWYLIQDTGKDIYRHGSMQPYRERMASDPLDTLVVRCYPGTDGDHNSYTLYEDDGLTTEYQQGKYATTRLSYHKEKHTVTVSIDATQGHYHGQLPKRAYRIEMPGTGRNCKVRLNGKRVKASYDPDIKGITACSSQLPVNRNVRFEITATE